MKGKGSIFRKESFESISSPEQLDEYIHVATISWWIPLLSLLVLLIGASLWAFLGAIPETESAAGLIVDSHTIVCFIPMDGNASSLMGKKAEVKLSEDMGSAEGVVSKMDDRPLSKAEASLLLDSDYLSQILVTSPFVHRAEIRTREEMNANAIGTVSFVSIVKESVQPITYVFGRM